MYFTGGEQRERSRYFDLLQQDTDRVLRISYVAAMSSFYGDLRYSNHHAFLPNIRSGRAFVPREYQRDEHAVAVLPVNKAAARRVGKMIGPLLTDYLPPRRIADQLRARDIDKTISRQQLLERWNPATPFKQWDVGELNNSYGAALRIGLRILHSGRRHQEQRSHPVVVVHQEAIQTAPQRFLVGTHMHTHVHNARLMEAAFVLPEYRVASELYATQHTVNVADAIGLELPYEISHINNLRWDHIGSEYMATAGLTQALRQEGITLPHQ